MKTTPASFPAGTQVQYSNTNTVLLGMVIEQITGKPVAEVFRTNLLQPLGMTQTSFPGLSADLPKPHLDGITEQGKPEGAGQGRHHWNPSWGFTAGEMISTLDDLRVWTVALGTGAGLVSEAMQAEREKSTLSTVPPNNVEQTYALGFFTRYGWWGHNGSLPGYTTFAAYQPNSKTSIVVMVNSDITSEQQPTAPADLVARAMMSELADAGLVPPPPSASESAGRRRPPRADLARGPRSFVAQRRRGSIRAARIAGNSPKTMPITAAMPTANRATWGRPPLGWCCPAALPESL